MQKRKWSNEEKKLIVLEILSCKKSAAQVAKEYGVSDSVAYKWRDQALKGIDLGLSSNISNPTKNNDAERDRLLKIIGEQACVIDTLKKISNQV